MTSLRAVLFGLAMAAPAAAQDARPAPFTQAQADQGAAVYRDNCATCHGAQLANAEFGPSLNNAAFKRKWGGQSAVSLFGFIKAQMPPGQAGSMGDDDYAAVVAYLIAANGGVAGQTPLPDDREALSAFVLPGK